MSATHPLQAEPSRTQKISLLIALYLAQGLPFGFFTLAIPVILREAGYSLKVISLFGLLSLPWTLKFLWASYLDHVGTRRAWLLFFQSAAIAGALLLSMSGLEGRFEWMLVVALLTFNLIAASQDVITDGLAVRMLDARDRGLANGIQVGAYRIGMVLGGGVLLWIFARIGWQVTFLCMAALLALTILPVFYLHEPLRSSSSHPSASQLAVGWVRRLLMPGMLGFAGLIFCYRFGDQLLTTLLTPFLVDQGMDKESIAILKGGVGSTTSVVGALIGGWLTFNWGRRTALLVSGIAQAASFSLYIAASLGAGGTSLLWVATIVEGLIGTMATVALFTLMMDASDPDHAGTDYTLFASIVILVGYAANFVGATIADAWGYAPAFTLGTALALLGCLAVVLVLDRKPMPERVGLVWGSK
jgi:MFS family permease